MFVFIGRLWRTPLWRFILASHETRNHILQSVLPVCEYRRSLCVSVALSWRLAPTLVTVSWFAAHCAMGLRPTLAACSGILQKTRRLFVFRENRENHRFVIGFSELLLTQTKLFVVCVVDVDLDLPWSSSFFFYSPDVILCGWLGLKLQLTN